MLGPKIIPDIVNSIYFLSSLGVGDVHGDAVRNVMGKLGSVFSTIPNSPGSVKPPFALGDYAGAKNLYNGVPESHYICTFDASGVVPVAAKTQTRAWGSLACVYLGLPQS